MLFAALMGFLAYVLVWLTGSFLLDNPSEMGFLVYIIFPIAVVILFGLLFLACSSFIMIQTFSIALFYSFIAVSFIVPWFKALGWIGDGFLVTLLTYILLLSNTKNYLLLCQQNKTPAAL